MNAQDSSMAANAMIFQSSNYFAALLAETSRPSAVYRPKLFKDGDCWCALYGDNIQAGVCAFGNLPDAAMRNFDAEWQGTP